MKKYLTQMIMAIIILAALPSIQARAESADAVRLAETGEVTIVSQHAAKDGVSSLQFSLSVDSANAQSVTFQFQENNAKVQEFRYDEDRKQLNVYLAGTEALFAQGSDALAVGTLVILDGNGGNASAAVSVVADSLRYVYGTELKTMEDLELPGAVHMGPQADPSWQEPDEDDDDDSQENGSSAGSQNSGNNSQPQGSPSASQGGSRGKQGNQNNQNNQSNNSSVPKPGSTREPSPTEKPGDTAGTEPAKDDGRNETGEAAGNPAEESVGRVQDNTRTEKGRDWIFVLVIIAVLAAAATVAMVIVVRVKSRRQDAPESKDGE